MTAGPPDGAARWKGRRRARVLALQALYECEIGGLTVTQALGVLDQLGLPESAELAEEDRAFAAALAAGAWDARRSIDGRIGDAARNWRVERMVALDRVLLRLAVHEMQAHPETPPKVVITEAIDIAREFSGEDAARFVNGVLDGVFKSLKDEGTIVE